MAKTISQLPDATVVNDSDELIIQQSGVTRRATKSEVLSGIFQYTLATAQNSTSGTNIDFTGIPSWARRVTIIFYGVSKSGTSAILVRAGTSSGFVTSTYVSTGNGFNASNQTGGLNSSAGFAIFTNADSDEIFGTMTLQKLDSGNTWVSSHYGRSNSTTSVCGGGAIFLSAGALDRIRITTVNGTDTFDAGTINIAYEG